MRRTPDPDRAPSTDPQRSRPLRAYLAALSVLFVVAATGALGAGWWSARRDALSAARADADFGARRAAEQIGRQLAVVRSSVQAVAGSPGAAGVYADPSACRLSFALGGTGDEGHLDVLRTDGTVACSSRPPAGAGDTAAHRGASWLAGASRAAQMAAPVTDGRTGRPAILISAPVAGLGMVVAFIDLVSLGATAGGVFGGARNLEFTLLSGDSGTVLTRWPDGARWAGTPVGLSRFVPPDSGGDGADVGGARRVYGQAPVEVLDARLFAGADRSAALAGSRRLVRWQAVPAGIGLLAGLLATLLVYRRITRPIGRLRAAVQTAAATGDLERTMTVSGPREVSELGAEFAGLLAVVDRELTERRQAEATARELDRNYRRMFESSPYPIYLFEVTTLDVVGANDAAVQYLGHDREALLRMRVTDLCPAEDAAALIEAMAGAEPVERGRRLRHRLADGTVTDVEVTSHLTSFGGRTVRCAVLDDVSEREHLHRRLRQSERLESLGQLAGGIAHDFNNLLGIINGYASMSAADVAEAASDDPAWSRLHGDLLEIVAAGDRAAALTRQLLAFSRADEVTEPRVLDLNEVVADVEKLLRRTLGEDVTLVTRLTAAPEPIKADVGRLEQVLVNLAVNARDAMARGGTLTIDTDAVTVDDHYAAQHPGVRSGRYMRLRVSDTGTGMSRATLERAFEPFFTTKPKGQGTGLGLATIYGIITQAGGHAQIYSEPGHGTTVAALLPVVDEAAAAAVAPVAAPAPGTGETVLLVEDDDSLRALTERILQRNGYTVVSAGTGAEALELAGDLDTLDLLLTDVVMPDMQGPELAVAMCAGRPALPVIYMSGYAETILAARSTLPENAMLLSKPVSAHQLLAAIPRALRAAGRSVARRP
ncbi:ATP-binding protein [Jidongwangia harbinensis]|uniref:ATP-binding protein n=1 Tax=Jidongwangia harbinensis TaxID=2878561 RepID=UPI001CD9D69E|nr:ATP-binding protein [Jidongwangia harbinensis]MCA2213180.1 response regulator [Jidongwangia harbinensis]